MYANTHGTAGVVITTASVSLLGVGVPIGLPIGLGLSFLSHFLLDYINEYHYKDGWVKHQLPSYIVFILCLLALTYFNNYQFSLIFIAGYLAGNSPDIIDKGVWFLKGRQRKDMFSCHNGNSLFFKYKNFKLGYPTLVNFDKTSQMQMQFIMTLILTLLTIYIIK